MEPQFNIWTVLLSAAALQGVFVSLLISMRKSKANNLLAGITLSFSICLFYYLIYWTGCLEFFHPEIQILGRLTYLLGPLLFFYVKSDSKQLFFKPVHFAPFILYLIAFQISQNPNLKWLFDLAQNIHLILYTVLVFYTVLKSRKTTNLEKKLFQWRLKLAWAFLGYTLAFVLYYVLVSFDALQLEYDYAIAVVSSCFIYYIGYQGFRKQDPLKVYENGKYHNSSLPISASESILLKIKNFMSDEQPYLNSSLKLNDFAKDLELSPHDVSQVINQMEGKNFTDFINEYRVEEAKKHLLSKEQKKIIHIAFDSGFNNRISFYTAFKKFAGRSPSEFKAASAYS